MNVFKLAIILLVLTTLPACQQSMGLSKIQRSEMLALTFETSPEEAVEIEEGLRKSCDDLNLNDDQKQFICLIVHNTLKVNENVYTERLSLLNQDDQSQAEIIEALKVKYRIHSNNYKSELLYKVDIIPVSLIAAQAAIESAWGTSRFAKEGYSFFGRHTSCNEPLAMKAKKANVCIKGYISAYNGIDDQILYFNSSDWKYSKQLRKLRHEQRVNSGVLNSYKLAKSLNGYAEAHDYVKNIQILIKKYALQGLDKH